MKYAISIFLACYAIFFVAGYLHGVSAAESAGPEAYLQNKLKYAREDGQVYLVYYDEHSDSVTYSLDDDAIIHRSKIVLINENALSEGTSNAKLMAGGAVVAGGGFIVANVGKIIQYASEQGARKNQSIVVAVLGSVAGYSSGVAFGNWSYEPDDENIGTVHQIADTAFWKAAENVVFDRYCGQIICNINTYADVHGKDAAWISERTESILTRATQTMELARAENRTLNTSDFDNVDSDANLPDDFAATIYEEENSWSWKKVLSWIFLAAFGFGCITVFVFLVSRIFKAFRSPATTRTKVARVELKSRQPKAVKKPRWHPLKVKP